MLPAAGIMSLSPLRDTAVRNSLASRTILLVEDDEDGGAMMKLALARQGASVSVADSAGAARLLLARQSFDGIVCDIGLPDEDGHTFMRATRASHPAIPAVALTGFSSNEDARRALEAGFDLHVAKPVDPFDLASKLARLLDKRRAR
jgi:CheY-like chemotaxis protein